MHNRYYYAQLAEINSQQVVVGVSDLSGPIDDPLLIELQKISDAMPGDIYENGIFTQPPVTEAMPLFVVDNSVILMDGNTLAPYNGIYFADVGAPIQITAELHNDDGLVDISIPIPIKMPLVRHANGKPTDDEAYFNAALNAGVITITGTLQRSGDWKVLTERNNQALRVIGADFQLSAPDVTLIA
jgi:hypothetical protein